MKHIVASRFHSNGPAATNIYTLSLHDALPILEGDIVARHPLDAKACLELGAHTGAGKLAGGLDRFDRLIDAFDQKAAAARSEEHTSELQSLAYLVCRLLLEKKKQSVYDRRDHE